MNVFLLTIVLLAAGHARADNEERVLLFHRHHLGKKTPNPAPVISGTISGISGSVPTPPPPPSPRPQPIKQLLKLALKIKLVMEAHEALTTLLERHAHKGNAPAQEMASILDRIKAAEAGVTGLVLGKDLVDKVQGLDARKQAAEDAAVQHIADSTRAIISGKAALLG